MPVGVFILAANGSAVYANATAKELLGRDVQDGDCMDNLADSYHAFRAGTDVLYPNEQMPVVRALHGERASTDDLEIELQDGKRRSLDITATPIVDDSGRTLFAVAVFKDISLRRAAEREVAQLNSLLEEKVRQRTEELAQTVARLEEEVARREMHEKELLRAKAAADRANRAKTMFLMNVSHELRTPLNHIIGFNDLLLDHPDSTPRAKRLAESVAESGRSLEEKLSDLIALARTETGISEDRAVAFDCDELLRAVGGAAGVRLEAEAPFGRLLGDLECAREVLTILFQRAVAAAPEEVLASVRTEPRSDDSAALVIQIVNARLATCVEALSSLFGEDMSSVDDAQRYRQQEIDFKLAVARARARMSGGDLRRAEGERSDVVELTLPIRRPVELR
jgi:signal transduction histidine kinase